MAEAIPSGKRVTLGGDKNYDTQEFVRELRGMNITPHVAQNDTNRRSAVDERTTRHAGYEISQRKRKRVAVSYTHLDVYKRQLRNSIVRVPCLGTTGASRTRLWQQ